MTGKDMIDFIRYHHLELAKISVNKKYFSIDFDIPLDHEECKVIKYSIDDMNHSEQDPIEYFDDVYKLNIESDGYVSYLDASGFDIEITSYKEEEVLRACIKSEYNDGEKLINYIEDNYLHSHIVVADIKNDKIKFVKRIIVEDSYTFDNKQDVIIRSEYDNSIITTVNISDSILTIVDTMTKKSRKIRK